MGSAVQAFDGCYEAGRAAALSGVPSSTVYHWARKGIVVPSVSPVKEKLWSYADLMALRIIHWLRHPKGDVEAPASPMNEVRRALSVLEERGLDIWQHGADVPSPLLVDRAGRIYIHDDGDVTDVRRAGRFADLLDLLAPFRVEDHAGPDLRRPRPHIRIVPGKCAGEPHLEGSRLTTLSLAALADRGFDAEAIAKLYPDEDAVAIAEALDLERQLLPVAA